MKTYKITYYEDITWEKRFLIIKADYYFSSESMTRFYIENGRDKEEIATVRYYKLISIIRTDEYSVGAQRRT